VLDRVAPKGDRSRYIDQAVRERAARLARARLRRELKEGAIRNAERDRQLTAAWDGLSAEVWARNADTDHDGLADGPELRMGTNPRAADTDGDGRDDGREALDHDDPREVDEHGDVEVELEVPLDSATPAFVVLGGRLTIDASTADLEGAADLDDLQAEVEAARAAGRVLQVEIEICPASLAGTGTLVACKIEVEGVSGGDDDHDDDDHDDGDDDHDDGDDDD
jgi:CopG family transcriptional regulator/antitoxin EndoAI